jgi:hypothetical protein
MYYLLQHILCLISYFKLYSINSVIYDANSILYDYIHDPAGWLIHHVYDINSSACYSVLATFCLRSIDKQGGRT